MRRLLCSKSNRCTEDMAVGGGGISVKAGVHYPARSAAVQVVIKEMTEKPSQDRTVAQRRR
jgi:hypothetical protein